MTLWAALVGALLSGGVALVVAGFRAPAALPPHPGPVRVWGRIRRRSAGRAGRARDLRVVVGLLVGLVGYAATGWLIWWAIGPLMVFLLPRLLADPPAPTIDQLGALDRWVHLIIGALPTGQSVADAIRTSRRGAPALLAGPIDQVVRRLDQRWSVRDALQEMADGLATPEADAVIAALGLAAHRGGTGAGFTLEALSSSIQRTLAALREIETERAKPRIVVRQVTVITLATLVAALIFGGDFFAPYATPLGQALLGVLIAAYLGALAMMRRLTRPRIRDRILVGGDRAGGGPALAGRAGGNGAGPRPATPIGGSS